MACTEFSKQPARLIVILRTKRRWFAEHVGEAKPIVQWLDMAIGERLSDLGRFSEAVAVFDAVSKNPIAGSASPWPDNGGIEFEHGRAAVGAGQRERGPLRVGLRKAIRSKDMGMVKKLIELLPENEQAEWRRQAAQPS